MGKDPFYVEVYLSLPDLEGQTQLYHRVLTDVKNTLTPLSVACNTLDDL